MRCLLLLSILSCVFAASPQPTTEVEGLRTGLLLEVYDAKGREWQQLPGFDRMDPIATEVVDRAVLREKHKKDYIGLRFSGYLFVREAGDYVFGTESDDGSTIHLGGELIVDNDGNHGVQTRKAKRWIERGLYPISIRWYNGVRNPTLRTWWTGSSQSQMAFGGADVYHPPTTEERMDGRPSLSLADLGLAERSGPAPADIGTGLEADAPRSSEVVLVQRGLSPLEIGGLASLALLLVIFILWRLLRSDADDLERISSDLERGRGRRRSRR